MHKASAKEQTVRKRIGIALLFVSMGLFYWGYHKSQQYDKPVAGLLEKDNGTRPVLYINAAAAVLLLVGGYLAMEEYS